MKLSFATLGCPAWSLEKIAAEAARLGFEGVELRGQPGEHIGPDETPESRAAIRSLFQKQGVEVAAIMGYSNFAGGDDAVRRQAVAGATAMVKLAAGVGCPVLRVFGGQIGEGASREEGIARVVAGLKAVGAVAQGCGVKLALETHDDWCVGAFLAEVLARVDSPAVGACWDVGNSFFYEPAEKTFAAIGARIYHVHFKDAAKAEKGVHSMLPGTGQVDMRKALRLLRDGSYRGYLSFEWEKKWEPDLAEPEIAFPHYVKFVRAMMKEEGV
jgi:sugar phosphate isomerase/epimerase